MRIHEYRAKERFAAAGIPTPPSTPVADLESALEAARELGFPVAVKAQVPVGGRGNAGGIAIVESESELEAATAEILDMELDGYTVDIVLIEAAIDPLQELYVGVTMDRGEGKPVIMASAKGGVDIETVAAESPAAISREHVDPAFGLHPYQARNVVYRVDIPDAVASEVAEVLQTLYTVWESQDATDAEINPLMVTESDEVIAADAVLNIDDDALFRQPELADMDAEATGEGVESLAADAEFEYVRLSGSVGVIGNGAGLVMTTLDLIEYYGGSPANFLDVGGGADAERVGAALDVVFSDPSVEVVLINIFGGITRGDEVAAGINQALADYDTVPNPIVVRLAGTNAPRGRDQLTTAVHTEETFERAVKRAVDLSAGGGQ
ncbi:ADP-forming succinate--CoA ligase subunit beta [Halodesulfurarchaeum sp.]|uniref:ADP-forming succinate--CoA ligase subunit beta n=1 Tax=Halodesulfurarchaeum sp. TaxID=1980530 RepID=UPI002FC3CF4D